MVLADITAFLSDYPKSVKIMEVCGSHTASIVKNGLRQLLSPAIRLVSGPGCPVCVTPVGYIDSLVKAALTPGHTVLCFGDLLRVPGSVLSLAAAKAAGGSVEMFYSPLEAVALAQESPGQIFVIAAIGFETTVPVFAVLMEQIISENIHNIRLATALKTMPEILDVVCAADEIDGFIAPGHVSTVTGLEPFERLAEKYRKPFVIAGFEPEHILAAVYEIIAQLETGRIKAENLYPAAVSGRPQPVARELIDKFFTPVDTDWRGLGSVPRSGLALKPEYQQFHWPYDPTDSEKTACRCRDIMLGRILPPECPLFGSACTPENPVGACMVSGEGACGIYQAAAVPI